jgi:PAS domain S-box-containing protein
MLATKNGKEHKYFNLVCQPYFETNTAKATGVLSFFSDVTDKIAAKQALKESHERFSAAIEAIQGILWTNSAEGKMVGEQKGWARLTGQSFEEYQDYGWASAVHPEDAQPTITAWNEAVTEKKMFVYEHRVRKADREWGIYSIRAIPLLHEDGSIREWVGVHTDITKQRESEKTIKESEQRFRNLADESPMFVFIIEPGAEVSVSYWNQTWLRYTGQSMTEAIGRAWNGIIHPDDVPIVLEYYTSAFQKLQAYFIPAVRVKRHDDKYRWHTFKGNPRYSPGGAFNGYVGVGFDIHEQKLTEEALKQSEERTRLAVESARLGTFEINLAEQTMIYSSRTAEIFGLDPAHHWNYKVFIDAVYPDDVPIRNRAHARARETGELLYETRIVLPDGTIRFVRLNGKYVYKDAVQFVIGTLIDITEEKQSAEMLEQKIEERTRELRQVNDQLKQFTYSASHDLQEPLRKISFFLDKLLVNLGPTLNEDNKKIAERVQQTTGRMRLLIDDLLAYSNTTLGVTSFSEVDLNDTIKSVVDDMEVTVTEKCAKINVEPLLPVKGDQRQLRQLFQNLIGNALKYHKKNVPPQVYISARFVTEKDIPDDLARAIARYDFYEILVKDNGIGFEPGDSERIFRLFHRLHGKSEYEGTGVGLAIVQKVVENHRGYIRAEAVPGEGAVFKIYLPFSQ